MTKSPETRNPNLEAPETPGHRADVIRPMGLRVGVALWWISVTLLAAPLLAVTTVRLLPITVERAVQLSSFAPVAALGYPLLAMLLAVRLRRRLRTVGVAALVAVGLAVVHITWVLPQWTGDIPAAAPGSGPLHLMTINTLKGSADLRAIVRLAEEAHVDVLVVEELTNPAAGAMTDLGLGGMLPYIAGKPATGASGTVIYSRFPISSVAKIDTFLGSWSMNVQTPDGALRLLAVHPVPPLNVQKWSSEHRLVFGAAPGADVIIGDFNASSDHAPMRELLGAGWRSAAEVANAGWQPTWPANGKVSLLGFTVPSLVQIDHVLLGPRMTSSGTRTVTVAGSDHRAVIAEIAFRAT